MLKSMPLTPSDVTLMSWDEYFREGGTLNQPSWLQNDKLKKLKTFYARLARLGIGANPSPVKTSPGNVDVFVGKFPG